MTNPSPDLFSHAAAAKNGLNQPLAARLRPQSLDEVAGQKHLLAPGSLLRRAIEADSFSSIILCGPPGTGKTSLAEVIARSTKSHFTAMSALDSSVAEVRAAIKEAGERLRFGEGRTILFIDELHRFSKSQQDTLLRDIESGAIRFVGATTANPRFGLVPALVSRSLVFVLEALPEEEIAGLLQRALSHPRGFPGRHIVLEPAAAGFLANVCEGDARRALGALELAVLTAADDDAGTQIIDEKLVRDCIQRKSMVYDDDAHYDSASAFIKSMRGSDANAAVYWLARMLAGGEDPRFIARRLMIFASEDVGNADPRALQLCVSAAQAVEMVGMPEARIILSQAVTYCATSPKSNAAYKAINEALADVEAQRVLPVPKHLRDGNSSGSREPRPAYKYPHEAPEGFVAQDYLGVERRYYEPTERGYEKSLRERIAYWDQIRERAQNQS